MSRIILVAHAKGEEDLAEKLAEPLRKEGYEVVTEKTVLIGDSFTENAQKILVARGAVVVCGTARAIGTRWTRNVVQARSAQGGFLLFVVQMEEEADIEQLSFDRKVAAWWQNPAKATTALLQALQTYYPAQEVPQEDHPTPDIERRYRELALRSYDIIDIGNLPEDRHLATQQLELRRLYVPMRVRVEVPWRSDIEEQEVRIPQQRRMGEEALKRFPGSAVEEVPIGTHIGAANRLVILGDPGAGKSTILRWVATAYLLRMNQDPDWRELPASGTLPDRDRLPIMVRCRELDSSCIHGTLDDILRQMLRKLEVPHDDWSAIRKLIRTYLERARAILLIDGLDEIQDPAARAEFCRQIESISVAYPIAQILVTSRIVGYREMGYRIGRDFEHVTVADLSRDDKDEFARRWCRLTERDPQRKQTAADELIRDIHSSDRIERMTGNPMLLTTMALVKRKVGQLPRRRADLYREAVQVLLNWRSPLDPPIDVREALPQLEYLAYAMCDRGIQQILEEEVLDLFARIRDEYPSLHDVKNHSPKEFLRLLERRTGILAETGRLPHLGLEVPVFEFRHLTFQEYLAALALVHRRFPGRDRASSLAQDVGPLAARTSVVAGEEAVIENWREALRLCVTCCADDDVDGVLESILGPEGPQSGPARARAVLAARCLADEPNCSERQAALVLRCFVAQLDNRDLGLGSTTADIAAIELTSSRWSQSIRAALIEEFFTRDSVPAGWMAIFIPPGLKGGHADSGASRERFIELLSSRDTMVRWIAVMALGQIGDARCVEPLLERLRDQSKDICHVAAAALATIGVPQAISALKQQLTDEDRHVRETALFGLSGLYGKQDQILLSLGLNGFRPAWDPCQPITEARLVKGAIHLGTTQASIRARYEELARDLALHLSWQPDSLLLDPHRVERAPHKDH